MTRIKELREALGIKQEELAMLCNVTQSTISLWEIGKTAPRRKALEKLADRFGVSAGYILGIEGESEDTDSKEVRPRTTEARILSAGVDKMPARDRERVLNMVRLMFDQYEEYFEERNDDDDPKS